mgnify:CR=1 FL=1
MSTRAHNCYELIDKALAEHGVRLSMSIQISPTTGDVQVTPRLPLEPIDESRAAKKIARTTSMIASHCPFCGIELERLT